MINKFLLLWVCHPPHIGNTNTLHSYRDSLGLVSWTDTRILVLWVRSLRNEFHTHSVVGCECRRYRCAARLPCRLLFWDLQDLLRMHGLRLDTHRQVYRWWRAWELWYSWVDLEKHKRRKDWRLKLLSDYNSQLLPSLRLGPRLPLPLNGPEYPHFRSQHKPR